MGELSLDRSDAAERAREDGRSLCIGVFGSEGSFTEEAARAWADQAGLAEGVDVNFVHLVDLNGLLVALERGRIARAVLPIHNRSAGLVLASFEALGRHAFRPVGSVRLAIRQALCLRSADVDPAAVRAVVSHPHALAQCAANLERLLPAAERVPWSDTASAARDLAHGHLPAAMTAVLASHAAARHFGLFVLAPDAQDASDNETTFLVIARPGGEETR